MKHFILKKYFRLFQKAAVQGSFWQGFVASISVVIVSELGDKTFFIAAIMAMKHPRIIVFAGAISALVFMTILSAAFGWIATVIPRVYIHYVSAALFAIFGLKMLRDGWKMDPNEGQEELEEVQSELKRREDQVNCLIYFIFGSVYSWNIKDFILFAFLKLISSLLCV